MTTQIARPLLGILLAPFLTVGAAPAQTDTPEPTLRKRAEALHVAGMFGDRMVLQQQTSVPIWGRARPNAEVRVAASWRASTANVVADESGAWRVDIETPAAGGPFTLAVTSGGERREFCDVLAGEVWLCSGQSNMQWKLRGFGKDHFKEDVARANYPEVRFCQVPQVLGLEPQTDLQTQWEACTPASVLPLSCVAYFFGEKLHAELGVPIGLISTSWGGSSMEAWMDARVLAEDFPEFRSTLDRNDAQAKQHGTLFRGREKRPRGLNQRRPSVLYNTMIHPIAPYAMRGVIWYQGESNVERPIQYRSLFPAMIDSWRQEWGRGDFPFYYVQIAPFAYRDKKLPAALLREAQLQTLVVPKTGMVVTMDIGNPDNIHPKAKKPVGHRLARLALARDYGRSSLIDSGPEYVDHTVNAGRIRLRFKHVGGGLTSRDGQALSHFSIAGDDRVFHAAQASIDGDTIVVHTKQVPSPVAVRYAWGNSDEPNLSNQAGLPASSFRTDSWAIAPRTPAKKPARTARQQPAKQKPAAETGSSKRTPAETRPPNIVYIMSDEWAYYESSHMGNSKLRTPNIDQMAREGMRFTRALAAAPVCAPVRCCLMTGKHAGHASVRTNGGGTPIRAEEQTIATMLKSRGYATGGFGKWGIGGRGSEGVPESHGFDEFFGYYDQVHAHSFYTAHLIRNSEEVPLAGNKGGRVGETYSHYEIMKEGLSFIRRNKDRPFFCYLPITPPHGMYDIPADDPAFDLYRDSDWIQDPAVPQDAKNYAAMVSMIDRDLQRVLDLLKELSLDENTIVFFTGDNGGQDRFADEQHPRGFFGPNVNPKTGVAFRGQKRSLYDGALRIPFLVRWPEHIQAGQTSDHLFYQVDMMATLAELTQSELPKDGDGISIAPALLGAHAVGHSQGQHETMYWEYGGQRAVRKGDWKAVRPGPKAEWELYDLATDPSEAQNHASKRPALLTELRQVAERSHERAQPGKFLRRDLQKRDRIARNGVPEPLGPEPLGPEPLRSGPSKIGNRVSHGPILGSPSATTMSIWARTAKTGAFLVEFAPRGQNAKATRVEATTALDRDNTGVAVLTDLRPDTWYLYEVFCEGSQQPHKTGSFKTWPSAEQTRNDEHNPKGLFNFQFEFACGNSQGLRDGDKLTQPTFQTLLRDHADKLDFAILNGDWLYEDKRDYSLADWRTQTGAQELPKRLRLIPRIVGIWENYKAYLSRGRSLSEFHRRVPSFFTIDDHEILNDVAGSGQAGFKERRAVLRDVGVQAWMDYLAWGNPMDFPSEGHFGRASMKSGSRVLRDEDTDFRSIPLERMSNLHVHWGGDRFSERLKKQDEYPRLPNAGVYAIEDRIAANELRVEPAAEADSKDSVYSIGRRLYGQYTVSNCHFFLLDTRSHRDVPDFGNPNRADRSMLGEEQLDWLLEGVAQSTAEFIFIVSSVNFMVPHTEPGSAPGAVPKKGEAWTVFLNERERLLNVWDEMKKPVFLLTGDLHNSFAIRISDNIWEFASGPHESNNHHIGSEGHRPLNGAFQYGPRACEILWSTYLLPDTPRAFRRTPSFCVVQVNNVTNNPIEAGVNRWIAFPRPQVVFQYYDGITGDLKFAQTITAGQ